MDNPKVAARRSETRSPKEGRNPKPEDRGPGSWNAALLQGGEDYTLRNISTHLIVDAKSGS